MRRTAAFLAGLMLAGPQVAAAQNVYFGNLHAHTGYSDGSGTPAEAFAGARAAGLDFIAVTEHNHDKADGTGVRRDGRLIARQPTLYVGAADSLVSAATAATRDGAFVALYGQEVSTISAGNHINVFEAPRVIPTANGDVPGLLAWSRANPASAGVETVMQFNHPRGGVGEPKDYGRDDFPSERAWVDALEPHIQLIEVLNAPALKDGVGFRTHHHEREYFGYLNLGFHVAPSVGHDNHYRNWGASTDARVAVLASALTRPALLDALRRRHAYASEDRNLKVIFRANGGLTGDILAPPAPGAELDLSVSLSDPDEPTARYRIDVFLDEPGGAAARAPVESFETRGDSTRRLDGVRFTRPGAFVLLRITQFAALEDEDHEGEDDRVWTAPVWFEFDRAPTAPVPPPSLRMVSLLPNPAGDDVENESVVVRNDGATALDLTGWTVRDLAENSWRLGEVQLAPGQELTVQRRGQAMSMNNGGDTIELLDPAGVPVQATTYAGVTEDEIVRP